MKPISCTKDKPADLTDRHHVYYHKDAKLIAGLPKPKHDGDITILHCPNCGLDFPVTVRKL